MSEKEETKYEDIEIDGNKYLVAVTHRINEYDTSISSHVSIVFYKRVGTAHSFLPLRRNQKVQSSAPTANKEVEE